ncbi:MAG: DUF5693 family protein [Candidatus Baltobacteraceae bacterium]
MAVLGLALLAALYVAVVRAHVESQSRRVELAMDYTDFSSLARSYGYDELQFLIALRRAGLTSLAVAEQLGSGINVDSGAILIPGQTLIDDARLAPLKEPTLAALAERGQISPNELYLLVYAPSDLGRYREAVALHLGPHAVRTLRAANPAILAIRSQSDFFGSLGLLLPSAPLELARRANLLLIPRVQNDERFDARQIDRLFEDFKRHERVSSVVFFGLRNEVLGYPDHLDDTANAFKREQYNFGSIEAYDASQVQKGNEGLALRTIALTTRVQAISKAELDKLDFQTIVARYLLGVTERNVRIAYLRPWQHQLGTLSIEATNVELVRQIADGLRARGFTLGRATPVRAFRIHPLVIAIVSLAVPAIFLLLLGVLGLRRRAWWYAAFGLDLALLVAGYVAHHDLLSRKLIALTGAILFATAAVVAVARWFVAPAPTSYPRAVLAGLRTLGVASAVALGGALVVVGLLSVPATMEEIERFSGVKAVLVVPPLLALGLYLYTRIFRDDPLDAAQSVRAPVRVYALAIAVVLLGAAAVYVARSGNQSDITPSAFELSLRSGLTSILGVRPRFKEFLVGFPLMMLLPALLPAHRRALGWLFALGIGVGAADIVDTFSHLHTPLAVSVIRVVNGAVVGAIVGALAIAIYRRFARTRVAPTHA